jgi:hypothetical protein
VRRAVLLLALVPVAAQAAPTGLNQIPTTDLVPFEQCTLQVQNNNTEIDGDHAFFHDFEPSPQSEFGLPWNMEAGLDVMPANPPGEYRPIFNLKWRPIAEDDYIPAIAGGITQVGPEFTPNYYLVFSKTLNYEEIQYQKFRAHHRNIKLRGIRIHAGIQRTSNAWEALLGTDIELSDYFVIYSDWISGSDNAVSLGGVLVINRHLSVQASLLRSNSQDRLSGMIAQIAYTFDVTNPLDW